MILIIAYTYFLKHVLDSMPSELAADIKFVEKEKNNNKQIIMFANILK